MMHEIADRVDQGPASWAQQDATLVAPWAPASERVSSLRDIWRLVFPLGRYWSPAFVAWVEAGGTKSRRTEGAGGSMRDEGGGMPVGLDKA